LEELLRGNGVYGVNLGVGTPILLMISFTDDLIIMNNNGTYHRIRHNRPASPSSKGQGA
jgi:hypothetical protein